MIVPLKRPPNPTSDPTKSQLYGSGLPTRLNPPAHATPAVSRKLQPPNFLEEAALRSIVRKKRKNIGRIGKIIIIHIHIFKFIFIFLPSFIHPLLPFMLINPPRHSKPSASISPLKNNDTWGGKSDLCDLSHVSRNQGKNLSQGPVKGHV